MPLIFDRFYRGTELNEARSTGSGLGLSIVKSIVDMHHGTIVVESRAGHGSRFVVTLPRDPREVDRGRARRRRPARRPRRPPATTGDAPASRPTTRTWTFLHHLDDPALNHDPAPLSGVSDQAEPVITHTNQREAPPPMNDDQTPDAPQGTGPDPLDDTQPVDVPRYAPTPDPRPDARWAWASPPARRPPARPRPSAGTSRAPLRARPPYGTAPSWGQPATGAGTPPPPAYGTPAVQPDPQPRKRGGAGVGTVVAASLLSAVLASGGTVVALERTGAFDQAVAGLEPRRRRSPPRASSPSRSTSPRRSSTPPSGSARPSSRSRPRAPRPRTSSARSPPAASAPASSTTPTAGSSPTATSSRTPTRSPSSSRTAASSRARSTASTP